MASPFATLDKIVVFPIKSLPGIELIESRLLRDGALELDRRWAIVDRAGKFVNAKRTPRLHDLDLTADAESQSFTLTDRTRQRSGTFRLPSQITECEAWLSESFDQGVKLLENEYVGSPDDLEAPGPTVVSTQSLQEVASWFDLPLAETRQRFRANLEINASEPFAEDRLVGDNLDEVRFQIGAVTLAGMKACQRCPVPTRHPQTGAETPGFVAKFTQKRRETFPTFSPRGPFTHFYRLAVNTRLVSGPGMVRVGDPVTILGTW
jgi:uncharacterized protein YcbX